MACYWLQKIEVENHTSVLSSFGLSTKDDNCDLPSMYRTSKTLYIVFFPIEMVNPDTNI